MNILFLHGLGQNAESWETTIENINSEHSSICLKLNDLVCKNELTYQNLYSRLSKFCSASKKPVNLCGLSLGGVLAMNYAIDHPEAVRSLVLIATPYKMPKHLLRFQNLLFRFFPNSMFQQLGLTRQEMISLCSEMMDLDFSEKLNRISCPVLLLCGKKDRSNQQSSRNLASLIEDAQLQIVEHSGHEINLDAPLQLADILNGFYSELMD